MSNLSNPHDKFFKETFTRLEMARDFFANYLPEGVTAVLNLDSLSLQSGSFIDPDLQEQFADLLYRVTLHDDSQAYLYLLLEHKSYSDPRTPFQLLRYLVRIWERDEREGEGLRPIVPVVVYHGRERWRVALNFGGLFTGAEALRPYWPDFHYHLQDLSALSDEDIQGQVLLQAGLLVMKYIFDPALRGRFGEILALFSDLATSQTALEYLQTILYYVGRGSGYLAPEEMITIVQEVLADKGSDIMQTTADFWIEQGIERGIEQGIEQGIERGIEQGIEQGRVKMLQEDVLDLLAIRFEVVAEETAEEITAVTNIPLLRQLHREAATAVTLTTFIDKLTALTDDV